MNSMDEKYQSVGSDLLFITDGDIEFVGGPDSGWVVWPLCDWRVHHPTERSTTKSVFDTEKEAKDALRYFRENGKPRGAT